MAQENLHNGLGDTSIIDIPSFDLVPTPSATGVTDSSATADTDINIAKSGTIALPDLTKMGTQTSPASTSTQPTPSIIPSYIKYGVIGVAGLGVLALIYKMVKQGHERKAVYQNPITKRKRITISTKSWDTYTSKEKESLLDQLGFRGWLFGQYKFNDLPGVVKDALSKPILLPRIGRGFNKNPSPNTLESIESTSDSDKYKWYMEASKRAKRFGAYGDAKRFRKLAEKIKKVRGTMKLHSPHEDVREEKRQERVIREAVKGLKREGFMYKLYDDDSGNTVIDYYKNPRHKHRMIYSNLDKGAKVFTDFHGFEPTKLKEVTVPAEYPDKLVLIGKANSIRYESNKINGAPDDDGTNKLYHHELSKGSLWATDINGKGLYLIDPKLEIRPEGLVN